jgi:hypothetical protein
LSFADETKRYMPSNGPPAVEGDERCAFAAASKPKNATIHANPIRLLMGERTGRERRWREDQKMPSILNEAWEWLDRAEQAREVAGQLTDPSARKAVLELAQSFDRLARAAATPAVLRRRELMTKDHERN